MGPDIRTATARNTETLDAVNAQAIDDLLTYIALCESAPETPSAKTFDGSFLIATPEDYRDFIDPNIAGPQFVPIAREIQSCSGKFAFIMDNFPKWGETEPEKNIPYAVSCSREIHDLEINRRIRRADHIEGRDGHKLNAIEISSCVIFRDGYMRQIMKFHVYRSSRKILFPPEMGKKAYRIGATTGLISHIIAGIHIAKYRWSLHFRVVPNTPSVRFFTDPTGIKEFLKFRDRGDEKSRRPALAHWVTQHWRQLRSDPDVETYVREHLRGQTRCSWHGMEATIHIPDRDLAVAEVARAHRKRLSAAQLDRRLRRHRKGQQG